MRLYKHDFALPAFLRFMKNLSKVSLLAFFLAVFTIGVTAQEVTVSEEVVVRSEDHFTIIGEIENRLLVLIERNRQVELLSFDQNMRLRNQTKTDIGGRQSRLVGNSQNSGNTFFLFTQQKEGDEYFIIAWEYSSTANLRDSSTIAIAPHAYGFSNFLFAQSEDRSKAVFFRSDNSREVQAFCYDLDSRDVIWDKNIVVEGNLRTDFRQLLVTDEGNLAIVMETGQKGFRRKGMEYQFINYHFERDEVSRNSFETEDIFSNSVVFKVDNQNQFILGAGLYYEQSASRSDGHFIIYVDLKFPANQQFYQHPFDAEFLSGISQQNINRNAVTDLEIRDVLLKNDGGVVIFSEINRVFERRPTYGERVWNRSYGRVGWIDFYIEDVIITSFDPQGQKQWNNVLFKKQYSQDDEAVYSSFFLFNTPTFLRLIFNDEIASNNTVSEYIVSAVGYAERKSVLNTEYQNLRLRMRDAIQLSSTAVVIPSEQKSQLKFVRVVF